MALEPLETWQATFADKVKPVEDDSFKDAISSWYASRIEGIALAGVTGPGLSFVFAASLFGQGLAAVVPSNIASVGANAIATAWANAVTASAAILAPASVIASPAAPSNTFSSVASTVIDPTGIQAGKAELQKLASASPVKQSNKSKLPELLRSATLLLTFTAAGLDSTPSPSGPLPLSLTSRGVV